MKVISYIAKVASITAIVLAAMAGVVYAATNINSDASEHWTWNDIDGWTNYYQMDNVTVTSQKIEGYATSTNSGYLSLDCATSPDGDICGTSDYGVQNNGSGDLSGYAWNDNYGWFSFWCDNHGGCGDSNYRVLIDPDTGVFTGYAWNDVIGWVSFNCSNHSGCSTSDYKVVTSWIATSTSGTLESSTFDTGSTNGARINSLLWQGSQPSGTSVRFKLAVSSATSGPWSFYGPDGTSNTYYTMSPNTTEPVDFSLHGDNRYFRYKAELVTNQAQTETPQVDDIIVNWSP